jgi:hypothetical protein
VLSRFFQAGITPAVEDLEIVVDAEINPDISEGRTVAETAPLDETIEGTGIIEERDGVNYIKESILSPNTETEKKLDRNFKNLIDSILNKD